MQLEQILSAAVAAVNEDDLTASVTASVSSSNISGLAHQVPSPAVPPQDSPTPPSAALHSRPHPATPPFYRSELPEEGLGEVSFFPLDDDSLVITSQQALAMFEAPPAPPPRPPPLDTPPIQPPAPTTPPQYYGHTGYTPAALQHEKDVIMDLTPQIETPVTEATFTEVQAVDSTFTEAQATEAIYTEVQAADTTFTEVQGAEETFTEVQAADTTFTEVPSAEAIYSEIQAADSTFTEVQGTEALYAGVPLTDGAPYNTMPLTEMTAAAYPEMTVPHSSYCGIPLTEVTLEEGEEGVPAASAEVEVLTSEEAPQYTPLTPATPLPAPVVVQVAGPGLSLAIPNTFMATHEKDITTPTFPPTPPPAERPPEHSDVLSALRASIFRSRARKRAAAPVEVEGDSKRGRKKRRAPPSPPPHPPAPEKSLSGEEEQQSPPSRQAPGEEDVVQVQLVYLVYPVDPPHGVNTPIMLSEAPMKRSHQDELLNFTPTASNKIVRIETTAEEGSSEYKNKPMSQWEYQDVVNFFLNGRMSDVDFNFSRISGLNGLELANLPRSVFLKLSSKYGDELYREVQRRILQERAGTLNQHYPASISTTPSPSSISTTSSSSSSSSSSSPLFSRNFIFTTSPHNHLGSHLTPQPSVICDAAAPYELRIEPPPPQPPAPSPLTFQRGAGMGGMFDRTPTAALKSVPPPLVALDDSGLEAGKEVTSESSVSRGGHVEQGHPAQEEVKVEPPKKRGPGRPKKPENELKKKKKKTGRLWEFIRNLLLNPETCPSMVRWENAEEGLFRFVDGEKVAKRWGERKQNKEMNYEKLSRAMRYYYKTHIFEAVIGRRLVYKFGKKATGWRPDNPNFLNPPPDPPPQQPPPQPPPIHLHTESTSQLCGYTDATPQMHHHTDSKPQLHLHPDSLSQLHHQSPPAHQHQDTTPPQQHQQQPDRQFLSSPPQMSLHQDNTTMSSPTHHHHTYLLQGFNLHQQHQQHPHHAT